MNYKNDIANQAQPQVQCVAVKADGSKLIRVYFNQTSSSVEDEDGAVRVLYSADYIELYSDKSDPVELSKEYAVSMAYNYGEYGVNTFQVNGVNTWLDKNTRAGINNAIETLKRQNKDTYTLILEAMHTMALSDAQKLMDSIEAYAYQSKIQCEKHVAAIKALNELKDILNYDYTSEYPDKLVFELK
jgi:hypothetical protein